MRRDARNGLAAQLLVGRVEAQLVAGPQRLELVRRVAAPAPQVQRDGAVKQSRIHVRKTEMLGESARDCALAACGRAVDRDDQPLARRHFSSEIPVQARAL